MVVVYLFQPLERDPCFKGTIKGKFCELYILAGFCESLLVIGGNFIQILGNFTGPCF